MSSVTSRDILLFIPNKIGYVRVITAIVLFFCMKNHPIYTLILYGISGFLDAFDGYAARMFNQGTKFGAVLDMVTDRCATSSLIVYLGVIYPDYFILWQLLVSLDLASHYMHMYSLLSSGSTSHKNVDKDQSRLLALYYTNRKVLFFVCMVNEFFYMALYLHHYHFFWLGTVTVFLSTPVWLFKQVANVIQLKNAALNLALIDAEERSKKH
ncbi:CDP-diacylglycerol-inositol 3-phosphatidyltransferase [Scheffersomyces spartinae]|uniref:CDP-diacylglycerol--inositol 3-phosphatidyltransferase n=1 Tax=Scheffersomyces spartinae TaxID=45513 RepID=A0A9P7V803_9ASCO|nr:CDP-diacylglycerol-inositol 3-phosphatidyltransferase [Scheffersomyces spartinae]KAG7192946.1 CDP-diacylglycerol-inositol 3-phosphatidyltransferase [Scheffersomyces spartinae]